MLQPRINGCNCFTKPFDLCEPPSRKVWTVDPTLFQFVFQTFKNVSVPTETVLAGNSKEILLYLLAQLWFVHTFSTSQLPHLSQRVKF